MYCNEELSNNVQSNMSLEESVEFFRRVVLKWNKMNDEEREAHETMLKTMKKKAKKSLKKFLKVRKIFLNLKFNLILIKFLIKCP